MKDTSIPLDEFFKIIKPQYIYLKITPHKSIRNYNSSNIAKSIALSWRAINKVIRIEQKKLWVECNFKVSYIIDIHSDNANFYFIVPEIFKSIIVEKMKEIWSKATIEVVDPIQPLSEKATKYQLYYKKEDALSLAVDKKSNEPLNSILTVLDIMKEEDRITVCYNFHPTSQFGWQEKHDQTIALYKAKKPIDKDKGSFTYIAKYVLNIIVEITETLIGVLNEFVTYKEKDNNKNLIESLAVALDTSSYKEISSDTKKKKEVPIIDTEIAIVSQSNDRTREYNNLNSVCSSYRSLDADNELQYKKLKKDFKLEDLNWNCIKNRFSVNECQNFIQIPGKELLEEHKINFIKTEENSIPDELKHGYINLGVNTCKGYKQNAYLEDEYSIGSLPLFLVARQGGGKSTFIANYVSYLVERGEGAIVPDYIKNCEMSKTIERVVPKDKLVIIDLSDPEQLQSLAFNEIKITSDMPWITRMKLANKKSELTIELVNSINTDGEPFSPKMSRFLTAATDIVYTLYGDATFRDVMNCLTNYKYRNEVIKNIPGELIDKFTDEIDSLEELNEYSKITKENPVSEVVGTRESKIEGIIDRMTLLKRDFYLKQMFNKSPENNIDLVEMQEQGKIILIRMPQDEFKKYVKNVITTFYVTKAWASAEARGKIHKEPLRCHLVIDELNQVPTAAKYLDKVITETRKYGFKPVISCQRLFQLDKEIIENLKGAGASFMLLKGTIKEDFNYLKSEIGDLFEYDDLKDMEEFSSLNVIQYSKNFATFITKLPPKLK